MTLNLISNINLRYNLSLNSRLKILNKYKNQNYLNLLPSELLIEVLSYLDIKDLVNICQISPEYQYLCEDEYIVNKVKFKGLDYYSNDKDEKNIEVIKVILKYRKNLMSSSLNSYLISQCNMKHINIIKLLLADFRVDPSYEDNLALAAAFSPYPPNPKMKNQTENVIKLLLADPRVSPARRHSFFLEKACEAGYIDVVRLLLADPRVNISEERGIGAACYQGYLEIVKLLLADSRINPSDNDNYLIYSLYESRCEYERGEYKINDGDDEDDDENLGINPVKYREHKDTYEEIINLLLKDLRVNPHNQSLYEVAFYTTHFHCSIDYGDEDYDFY